MDAFYDQDGNIGMGMDMGGVGGGPEDPAMGILAALSGGGKKKSQSPKEKVAVGSTKTGGKDVEKWLRSQGWGKGGS